jgi:hypothetical protein
MEILHDANLKKNNIKTGSTQDYLDIDEIKGDIVLLKNGGMRAVLMCSSINFALKSSQEQEAVIAAYQQFLNSLDFPLQVVINSPAMDISDYLQFLDERYREQQNELLKIQIADYREFVKELVKVTGVMSKRFFVVIPFSAMESKEDGALTKISTAFSGNKNLKGMESKDFHKYKAQLWQRVNHVVHGLGGMGVKAEPLKTQELIELFFSLYNPAGSAGQGRVQDLSQLDVSQ